jgi:hypothetical protein
VVSEKDVGIGRVVFGLAESQGGADGVAIPRQVGERVLQGIGFVESGENHGTTKGFGVEHPNQKGRRFLVTRELCQGRLEFCVRGFDVLEKFVEFAGASEFQRPVS